MGGLLKTIIGEELGWECIYNAARNQMWLKCDTLDKNSLIKNEIAIFYQDPLQNILKLGYYPFKISFKILNWFFYFWIDKHLL